MTIAGYIINNHTNVNIDIVFISIKQNWTFNINEWLDNVIFDIFLRDLLVLYLDCMSPGNLSGFIYHCLEVSICLGVLSGKDSGNF